MFGWKTTKSELIEQLRNQLAAAREESAVLRGECSRLEAVRAGKDALLEELHSQLVALREENGILREECAAQHEELEAARQAKPEDKNGRKGSRFMGDRCRDLTKRSMRNAVLRDPKRNLVAEMPPPGAIPAGASVVVEGPRSEKSA